MEAGGSRNERCTDDGSANAPAALDQVTCLGFWYTPVPEGLKAAVVAPPSKEICGVIDPIGAG